MTKLEDRVAYFKRHSPCHSGGGCIRGFADDACDEQGQCSVVLAILSAVEEEREACALLIEEGFDRTVDEPYRDDGKPSKNDRCAHDKAMYEDCEMCAAAAIRSRKVS